MKHNVICKCPYKVCQECPKYNYDRDGSHTHCWDQVDNEDSDIEPQDMPACGQPLEKHKQCCLCDMPAPDKIEVWEEEFNERT